MLRFVNICLVLALVALAYVIYEGKYEARALDEDIGGLRKKIETERDAVAVLRAEWSLLNRPERIERLAKKHLKLGAARPQQLVTIETVSDSDFERVRMEAAVEFVASRLGAAQQGQIRCHARCRCSGRSRESRRPAGCDQDGVGQDRPDQGGSHVPARLSSARDGFTARAIGRGFGSRTPYQRRLVTGRARLAGEEPQSL